MLDTYTYTYKTTHFWQGDAIEACGCLGDKGYFDSIIRMDGCYSVSNYMCDNANTFFVTVPHKTKIKLGRAAKFKEIRDDGFPVYYSIFLHMVN